MRCDFWFNVAEPIIAQSVSNISGDKSIILYGYKKSNVYEYLYK